MDQVSKKRLFGSFSDHISTKKASPFPRRYPSKVTLVFVVCLESQETPQNKQSGRGPQTRGGGLEHIFAAIWAVP
jgi:hypothetical protein